MKRREHDFFTMPDLQRGKCDFELTLSVTQQIVMACIRYQQAVIVDAVVMQAPKDRRTQRSQSFTGSR
jgi:hypothetical protein